MNLYNLFFCDIIMINKLIQFVPKENTMLITRLEAMLGFYNVSKSAAGKRLVIDNVGYILDQELKLKEDWEKDVRNYYDKQMGTQGKETK